MRLTPTLTRNGLLFATLIFGIVLWGFWTTYFSNPFQVSGFYLQLHGAGMSLWCVMLISQAYLVRSRRLDLHRMIGKTAYVLVPLNMLLMLATVRIRMPTWPDTFEQGAITPASYVFISESFVDVFLFGLFFALAMVNRKTPAVHARYMLCTPLPVIAAAVDRIIRATIPELGSVLPQVAGAEHLQTSTWILVDIGLLALAFRDWKSRQPVNVFARVFGIFFALQVFTVYSHQMPFMRALGDWFLGV